MTLARLPASVLPSRRRGFVLLPVVLLITLIAVAAFSLNQLGPMQVQAVATQAEGQFAEQLARAGLEHAGWLVQNSHCGGGTTVVNQTLGDNSYTATVTSGATSTRYTLSADQDAWLRESAPDVNYASDPELLAKTTAGDAMRALYRFDLGSIPAGAQIGSALAWFYVKAHDDEGAVTLHRVTADWTEAGATWASVGSQFDSQVLATIPAQSANGVWVQLNITAQVQAWVNGSDPNYGVMLMATSDNKESRYASREWSTAAERPRLQVVTVSGTVSPVSTTATATLAGGVSRSLSRDSVTAYQPPSTVVWQPGAELEDAFIWDGAKKNNNFGSSPLLNLSSDRNVLLRFALDRFPPGARVANARLALYLQGGSGVANGVLDLHAVNRAWVEGAYDDGKPAAGEGVTYVEYDGGNLWLAPGGDYAAAVIDSITLPTATPGWYEWDVSRQMQAWLDGEPNYGLLLRAGGGDAGDINFVSSDNATSPALRPRLTVSLQCECGTACVIPQGSGGLLLVVADAANLSAGEQRLQATFQAWGYEVTLLSADASQATFDSQVAGHDVVYVAQSASSASVGSKLTNAAIGVVSENGDLNSALGIADSKATVVADAVNLVDNSHYITAPFASGAMPIYSAPMEGIAVAGVAAPGLQTLAEWNAAAALVVLEQGAETTVGAGAAGRRVTLPLGRTTDSNFNWQYLNANGRLMVQRALQWGTGNTDGGSEPFVCDGVYLDTFDSRDWNGDDGTVTPWTDPWVEVGESDGATKGDVQVAADESNYQLRIGDNDNGGEGVERRVDLSGAATAILSFDYRRNNLDDSNDYVAVYVSNSGTGGPWSEIARIAGGSNDASYQSYSQDISDHISAQTAIRLRSSSSMGVTDVVWFDNIQIACTP